MKEKNAKTIVSWALLIGWMILIFVMSNQPASVSDSQSGFVIYAFNLLGISLDSFFGELANFAVRKTAHFTEYMILFFFSYNVIRIYVEKKTAYMVGLLIVIGYACTDEIHQLFITGRAGKLKDVLIDTSGGLFGLIIIFINNYIKSKSKLIKKR